MLDAPVANASSSSPFRQFEAGRIAMPQAGAHPLIGRDRELETMANLLEHTHVRLLTLTGPGGVGKTRLAIKFAQEHYADFADGIVFIPLAPILDHRLVPTAIAQALEIRESRELSTLDRLCESLADAHLLLVLDNFEQIREAATDVGEIVARCPRIKVLVTSRIPLHITGEQEFAVPPLELPEDESIGLDELAGIPAVALFSQRARAVRADFALADGNADAVAAICRRLDGLPLAIELAAARAKVLSPQALNARLSQSLNLLTGGPRDQPERLQTLRAAIGWSHDLLTSDEQALFARVSVFSGGFSLDAVEAVTRRLDESDATTSPRLPVLDAIASLVDSSLLRAHEDAIGDTRFLMLETVREFGLEQLLARGELVNARDAHAAFFLELAERAEPDMYGSDHQAYQIELVEANHDNFRAALTWAEESSAEETGLRLAAALFFFWYIRGHMTEGRRWMARVLALGPGKPGPARAHALIGAGFLANWQGDFAAAIPFLKHGLAVAREVSDLRLTIYALGLIGNVSEDAGDYQQASELYEEAVALNSSGDGEIFNPSLIGQLGTHRGIVAWGLGEHQRAVQMWTKALADQQARHDQWGSANSLRYLAMVACEENDLDRAADLQRESLTHYWRVKAVDDVADAFSISACIGIKRGEFIRGARLLSAAEALREQIGSRAALPERLLFEQSEHTLRLALSERALTTAWSAGRTLTAAAGVAEALDLLSGISSPEPAQRQPAVELTGREQDVLRLLVLGHTDREIADVLYISPRTAQGHVARIFDKLGVNTRTAAVATALQTGLVAG